MKNNKLIFKNGDIIDGSGGPKYKSDILIVNDRIEKIGNINSNDADICLDIDGLVITPGFIDAHSHLDFFITSPTHSERLESWIRQGITTIVAGNCGYSPAPINDHITEFLNIYWDFALPRDGLDYQWNSMDEYFNHLQKIGQALNVAILTGHNTLRLNIMDLQARFAEESEIIEMKKLLKESLDAGSFGLSLGLGYVPGLFSHTDELIKLSSVLREYDAPLVPHTRGLLSKNYDKAISEVIEVAEKNDIPLQISHHAGGGIGRTRKKAIQAIKEAKNRGVEIGHDNIAWTNTSTTVLSLFPPWAFDGGIDKFFERLKDQTIQNQIKEEMLHFRPKWPNWEHNWWVDRDYNENIILSGFKLKEHKRFNNKQIREISNELGGNSLNILIDLVLKERGKFFIITGQFDNPLAEEYVANLFTDTDCSVGTDIVGIDQNTPHPVAYGTFPKILERIVREKQLISLERAIRQMTSLPATQMRIKNRGLIKKNFYADLVVFNPKKIKCTSSFSNPFNNPEGIKHVCLNGVLVLKDNEYNTNLLAGKVLRRNQPL